MAPAAIRSGSHLLKVRQRGAGQSNRLPGNGKSGLRVSRHTAKDVDDGEEGTRGRWKEGGRRGGGEVWGSKREEENA